MAPRETGGNSQVWLEGGPRSSKAPGKGGSPVGKVWGLRSPGATQGCSPAPTGTEHGRRVPAPARGPGRCWEKARTEGQGVGLSPCLSGFFSSSCRKGVGRGETKTPQAPPLPRRPL